MSPDFPAKKASSQERSLWRNSLSQLLLTQPASRARMRFLLPAAPGCLLSDLQNQLCYSSPTQPTTEGSLAAAWHSSLAGPIRIFLSCGLRLPPPPRWLAHDPSLTTRLPSLTREITGSANPFSCAQLWVFSRRFLCHIHRKFNLPSFRLFICACMGDGRGCHGVCMDIG